MTKTISVGELFGGNIDISVKQAVRVLKGFPSSATAFARIAAQLKRSERLREKHAENSVSF